MYIHITCQTAVQPVFGAARRRARSVRMCASMLLACARVCSLYVQTCSND